MLYAIVAVLAIVLDQWIKLYVATPGNVPSSGVPLIPGILNLHPFKNDGAAFGFLSGSNATIWFIVIAGVFTVLVILALATKFISGPLARWSIVLVTAGGVSNCIDRVINFNPGGYVQDMFEFEFAKNWFGGKGFPIFNLADVFITVFCLVFILAILFGRNPKEEEDYEFVEDEEEALEEEEEELRPKRAKKARKAAEEELPDEEAYEAPAKATRGSRKARQARYDEEYEQYKAAQRAAQEAQPEAEQPEPAAAEVPSFDPSDPFAEWERAKAAQPAEPKPEPFPAPAAKPAAQRPAPDYSGLATSPQFAAAKAAQEQPAPKPAAPKPAPKPVEVDESFSLDDILAEFK